MHIESHNPRNPKISGPFRRYGTGLGLATMAGAYGASGLGAATGSIPLTLAGFAGGVATGMGVLTHAVHKSERDED